MSLPLPHQALPALALGSSICTCPLRQVTSPRIDEGNAADYPIHLASNNQVEAILHALPSAMTHTTFFNSPLFCLIMSHVFFIKLCLCFLCVYGSPIAVSCPGPSTPLIPALIATSFLDGNNDGIV